MERVLINSELSRKIRVSSYNIKIVDSLKAILIVGKFEF